MRKQFLLLAVLEIEVAMQNISRKLQNFSNNKLYFGRLSNEIGFFKTLQTKLYTEDWIGLKTLDEAGKVKFLKVSGNHLQISQSDMKKYVVPYLEDQASTWSTTAKSSAFKWASRISNFFSELAGFAEEDQLLLRTHV